MFPNEYTCIHINCINYIKNLIVTVCFIHIFNLLILLISIIYLQIYTTSLIHLRLFYSLILDILKYLVCHNRICLYSVFYPLENIYTLREDETRPLIRFYKNYIYAHLKVGRSIYLLLPEIYGCDFEMQIDFCTYLHGVFSL